MRTLDCNASRFMQMLEELLKAKMPAKLGLAGRNGTFQILVELFDFDVIACVHFISGNGDQYRRRIRAGIQHDSFAQNFTR